MGKRDIIIAIAVCILIVFLASGFASQSPDGLEFVAEKFRLESDLPAIINYKFYMAEYAIPIIKSSFWSTAIAGLLGVLAVYFFATIVFRFILRRE